MKPGLLLSGVRHGESPAVGVLVSRVGSGTSRLAEHPRGPDAQDTQRRNRK